MANALPLLLVGAAALLLMGKKKKAPANGKEQPSRPLEPLAATTAYPPQPGKVFEPLNAIQMKVVLLGRAPDQAGVSLLYNPDNPTSVGFRTAFGHMAKDNPDLTFQAIRLSFVEYLIEEDPGISEDIREFADLLKSEVYGAIIDSSGYDTGVKSDPAKFAEEMAIAIYETRKEIKRWAEAEG